MKNASKTELTFPRHTNDLRNSKACPIPTNHFAITKAVLGKDSILILFSLFGAVGWYVVISKQGLAFSQSLLLLEMRAVKSDFSYF